MGFPHATDTLGITETNDTSVHLTLGLSLSDSEFNYITLGKDLFKFINMTEYLHIDLDNVPDYVYWAFQEPLPVGALVPSAVLEEPPDEEEERARATLIRQISER